MAFAELFVNFIYEIVMVYLFGIKLPDVTFFRLLYEVVEPTVIKDRLWRAVDHQQITFHLGLISGYEELLELFY